MRFSVFDGDEGLGLENARVVVLRGSTTVSQLFSPNLFDIRSWIKTALENAGFSVNAVRMSAAGWVGYSNNLEIEINVYLNFTAEQARQNAIQAIDSYTANFGMNRVFLNTTLSVVSDSLPVVALANVRNVRTASPISQYDYTGGQNVADDSGNFVRNFAAGLGLSTPVAVVGGGIFLLLLLRR